MIQTFCVFVVEVLRTPCPISFLIFCRVEVYIKYGWNQLLVDPDKGLNLRKKLTSFSAQHPESLLYRIYSITFGTIYDFLVDRKVILPKVSYLESVADQRAEKAYRYDFEDESDISCKENVSISTESTRTLSKAYRFFCDGHVQGIKLHPMPSLKDFICVTAKVLPSMRKDNIFGTHCDL